ncbi:hypothetical protein RJ639_002936 [Escallonia herrerae]|uniref:AP-3 complex subunit delta n=1 Tax=Escallonia herrerae TaxID=1293975 RepID=A0AA88W1X8_9ASTE|nr:hypothetical protein RJ639_002936 [Escallonia herrerae]
MSGGSSLMDSIFQRSLEDLIKSVRLHLPGGEPTVISKALEEIRREIRSTDLTTKAEALQKLTYLHSLHHADMSWAAFHAVELSSSAFLPHKRAAYLAASISFRPSTDVLLLLTNQLRKDLNSTNHLEGSLALECLSVICTPDLARDLTPDLFTMLGSSKNLVRKKAIATSLRVFSQYSDAVRVCFKRLVENLESGDVQTVSATVGVFCELALKEPRAYMPLAPEFYRILVDSRNNWVLIKVLKVFAKLAALEPRLAKKVVEPICEHMRRSGAKSLVFECIRTILSSLSEYESAVKLAVAKVREFLVDDDQNLRYLGLQALSLVDLKHLWAVLENKEVVIRSLSDADPNIKLEALQLVMAMVSEDNVTEICRVLITYALKADPEFCNEILGFILSACSRNVYEVIIDFDWYVSLLGEISRIPHCKKGEEIENQLTDIGMRVEDVRPELVHVGRNLLIDPALLGNPFIHRILCGAAWVSGEYVQFSTNPLELMEALLQPRTNLLPPSIRAVYIQSAFKVLTFCLNVAFLPNEAAYSSSSCPINEYSASPSFAGHESLTDCEQDEFLNLRVLSQSVKAPSVKNGGDTAVNHVKTSASLPLRNDILTQKSADKMFTLVKTALAPLVGSHEVEIHERVCNILGLLELTQNEMTGCFSREKGNFETEELKAYETIKMMRNAFSEEIGPVAVSARDRVPIPEGLVLEENLHNLETICGDVQFPISSSFFLGRPHSGERDGVSFFNRPIIEVSESSNESTLLTEHRKRHGLYYLPSDKKEVVSCEYPPPNDPKVQDDITDDAEDLVKLTEQSLVRKKKPSQAKPRPVVLKLDEGDEISVAAEKPESKDDMVSGAVRELLFGSDAIPPSTQINSSDKLSSKRSGKVSEVNENVGNVRKSEHRTPSSRKSKHHCHGKERESRSSEKNIELREENGQSNKQKSGHRHGRHKARQRADGIANVVSQTPVIPDFLL